MITNPSLRWFTFALSLSGLASAFLAFLPVSGAQDPLPRVRPDVVYGHKDGMALTFDVFEPKENRNGIGLLFMVSGGWVSQWMPPAAMSGLFQPLNDAGYTVIAVRHGSSPRYVIPEIVEDVRKALAHIHEHAAEFKIDPKKLGVFGFSAGGHLSLMLGTTANDRAADQPGPRIAAVAAIFPPPDLAPYMKEGNPLKEQFPALKFDLKKAGDYSPLIQVSSVDAPTLLVHGDKDELVPIWHSEKIHQAFEGQSVPSRLLVIQGAAHGFNAEGNQRMFQAMLEWFKEHLAP
jgi:acetyl esterase/lipase